MPPTITHLAMLLRHGAKAIKNLTLPLTVKDCPKSLSSDLPLPSQLPLPLPLPLVFAISLAISAGNAATASDTSAMSVRMAMQWRMVNFCARTTALCPSGPQSLATRSAMMSSASFSITLSVASVMLSLFPIVPLGYLHTKCWTARIATPVSFIRWSFLYCSPDHG